MAANTDKKHTIGVVVPKPLYDRIVKQAAKETRPVANLVLKVLADHFGEDAPHLNGASGHKPKAHRASV